MQNVKQPTCSTCDRSDTIHTAAAICKQVGWHEALACAAPLLLVFHLLLMLHTPNARSATRKCMEVRCFLARTCGKDCLIALPML